MQIILNNVLSRIYEAIFEFLKFITAFQSMVRLREVYAPFWVITRHIADLQYFKTIIAHKQMGEIYAVLSGLILFAA